MIVIAAGGTGGHMVPGLAIAAALERARPGTPICFVGAGRDLEASLAGGYAVYRTSVRSFSAGCRGRLAPLSVVPAIAQARSILRRTGARAVIGMGGYPSLPVVLAARSRRLPAILHEQNAVPGLANSVGARVTPHIGVSFEPALQAFGARRPRLVGLPLRAEIIALADPNRRAQARTEAMEHFALDPTRSTVLVSGGSLGAQRLNDATLDLAAAWASRDDIQILLACGRNNADALRERAAQTAGLHVIPFIERMDLAYAVADVAVTRGGASTVAELAATGTPAIIIPLPIARRKEQHANAAVLAAVGGATVLDNAEVTGERLRGLLEPLLTDAPAREAMAAAARTQARPDAADAMAAFVLEVIDAA
jgi:UDP-N-acetylglucosamine--N-acetylmuramyl-(pentapeptide) pyrophosphoryl-undecaprenol N-acetylglucosamine transferase